MPTQDPTVNYGWVLPDVGGDVGAWGGLLNAIFGDDATGIDPIVKAVSVVANAALPKAGGTMVGNLIATDNLYDIGASGATRFRDLWLARNLAVAGTAAITGAVTGGTYNGQTISATASFTGSVAVATSVTVANDSGIVFGARGALKQDGSFNYIFSTNSVANAFQVHVGGGAKATGPFEATGAVTLSSTLAVTSTATLSGGARTLAGVGTVPTATYTTLFAVGDGLFEVIAYSSSGYGTARVQRIAAISQGIISQTASGDFVDFNMSGANVQVKHSAGADREFTWSYLRII